MYVDKEVRLEYHRNYYRKLKDKCTSYLGGKCVVCGDTEDLEFDHIIPESKSFAITEKIKLRWDVLVVELDKCQLLCHEHHVEKHASEHGSVTRYINHKCRCELCLPVGRAYHRNYRRQRKSS